MTNIDLEVVRSTQAERLLNDRPPLVDDVHDVLVDMLMNHDLDAGARLNIDALARALGVSPTPVREALVRMEAEGLVVKEPRRGYTVTPLIEPRGSAGADRLPPAHRARGGCRRCAAGDGREAAALRAFARSGGAGDHDATANRLDMIYDATFHDTIAELGGNRWLRESLARLRSHLHMYRLYHHAGQAAATKPEHVAIARAIGRRDPDAAAEAMRAHLQTAMRRLDDVFASRQDPAPRVSR